MVRIHTTLLQRCLNLDKCQLAKRNFLRQVFSAYPEQNVSLLRSFFSDAKPEIECAFNWSLRCFLFAQSSLPTFGTVSFSRWPFRTPLKHNDDK